MMSQVMYARTRRTHMSCRRFELSTSKNADQQTPRPHARVAAGCLLMPEQCGIRACGRAPACLRALLREDGRQSRACFRFRCRPPHLRCSYQRV
jgi:hypothetical protein